MKKIIPRGEFHGPSRALLLGLACVHAGVGKGVAEQEGGGGGVGAHARHVPWEEKHSQALNVA